MITYAGPEAELEPVAPGPGVTEIDAAGAAVTPGFVDAHTHLVWLGDRSDEYARRAAGDSGSIGSATVAPMPRRKVRRGSDTLVTNIGLLILTRHSTRRPLRSQSRS